MDTGCHYFYCNTAIHGERSSTDRDAFYNVARLIEVMRKKTVCSLSMLGLKLFSTIARVSFINFV